MEVKSYTEVRENFDKLMAKVCEDHQPLVITRQRKKPVIVMSLDDYNSMQETMYLMSSPKNHAMLLKSISELTNSQFKQHDLIKRQE